jgi:ribosomal protein S18 acetylase RimI-like enzyme
MTTIRPANDTDLPAVLALRDEARRWLSAHGSDQWSQAWPDPDTMAETIADGIHRGETWCVDGDDGSVIATLTVNRSTYPGLWTEAEQREPALYVHRLIVARSIAHQGLGAELLDKVTQCATKRGAKFVRVDVWTTNTDLHRYYRQHGFRHVRTVDLPGYPSGAIFERLAN